MSEEQVLYQAHPAMFRNHPIWFMISVLMCLVGIVLLILIPWLRWTMDLAVAGGLIGVGLLILIPWWFQSRGVTLTVTTDRTRVRRGIFSKHTNSVFHENVRNIQVKQSLLQRLLGVGYIGVASAGHAGMEIEVQGVPNPEHVKDLIDQHRRSAVSSASDGE
jgi:uncharacterized membrane protein YdbT with pleckstrin-like domain